MEERYRAQHREAERDTLRDYVLSALRCVGWGGLGIACVLWSAQTTSQTYGWLAFWGGLAMGNAGIWFTLLAAYRRGERRGDW